MKRMIDFLVSLILVVTFLIPMIIVSIFIMLSMGPPVLFKQKRPGLNGNIFQIFKFRTMIDAKDKKGNLLSDEERLTSIGKFIRKFSLDELPQLFNVLKGDMSFVGPRPLLVEYLELYNNKQFKRHNVRPGITGWAQVNGRNAISWEERFELDVWYVENRSIFLDIKIILITVLKVFKSEGISQEGQVTMTKFTGNESQYDEDED